MTVTPMSPSIFAGTGAIPRFSAFDAAEVVPALRAVLARADVELTRLEAEAAAIDATPQGAEVLLASLERLEDPLGWAWGLVNHLNSVRTSDPLREAIEAIQPDVVTFLSRLGQSRPIHDALARLSPALDHDRQPALSRAVSLGLRAARHAGVAPAGEARDAFHQNQQELARLSLAYSNAVLDATRAFALTLTSPDEVEGLPESARALYAQAARANGAEDATPEAGPWRVGIDFASLGPFLEYASRRDLREQLHRAYVGRAGPGSEGDNSDRIRDMLRLRHDQAALLGFPNFAAMQLDTRMAPDVPAVTALLDALYASSHPAALREHAELVDFAADHGFAPVDGLRQWDLAFWSRRLREARYSYSDEDLRPYLSLPAVLEGLFDVVARAFGVRVVPRPEGAVDVWHPDVRYFDVQTIPASPGEAPMTVAGFFLDPYSRPEDKRGGAWMNECVGRSKALAPAGTTHRIPVAYLVCNQSPPVDGRPSLMTWNEVTTLFHEMGHGLQHMLTQVDLGAVAGIMGVEWDAIELPSQFMENWLRHKPTVARFARHWQTGEAIPEALLDRVLAASTFRAGSAFLRQLSFGRLDMALHDGFTPTPERDIWHLQREVLTTHGVLPPLPHDWFLCAFGHLFGGGYAAGYYSYKWAEVLSADAFAAFEEAGLDDREAVARTGARFRETVLGLGGSVPPAEVYRRFRGRDPDPQALLRHNGLAAA